MRWSWFVLGHTLWGSLIGGLLAVLTPLLFALVAGLWLAAFFELVRAQSAGQRWRRGLAAFLAQGVGLGATLAVAAFAPVKTEDRQLGQSVVLPREEMTLAELQVMAESGVLRVPALRSIRVPNPEARRVVRWSAREMTLRQFIAAIEEQTPLRHRFWGCGNGVTVLWGSDCAFGLTLRDPHEPLGP